MDASVDGQRSRTGQRCWPLAFCADTVESLDSVLSRIRLLDGIANTETSLLLSTHKL